MAMFFIYSLVSMGVLLGLVGITLLTKEMVQYRKNKSQPEADKLISKPGKKEKIVWWRGSNCGPRVLQLVRQATEPKMSSV